MVIYLDGRRGSLCRRPFFGQNKVWVLCLTDKKGKRVSKSAEFIKLLSVLVLSTLILGVLGFFIPKISALSELNNAQKNDLSIYDKPSSAGFGEELSRKIKTTLEKISGDGTVMVSVTADVVQGEETVQKNVLLPRSAVIKEHLKQFDEPANHVTEEQVIYNYSSEVYHETQNVHQVRKLAITVLVDGYMTQTQSGDMLYQPRSAIEMASYRALVTSIADFTPERGDTLELINLPFVKTHDNQLFGFDKTVVIQSVLLALFFVLALTLLVRFILPMIYMIMQPTPVQQASFACVGGSEQTDTLNVGGKKSVIQNLFRYKSQEVLSVLKQWLYMPVSGDLNGVQKTAILLLALGESYIKPIFLKLKSEEVVNISRTMAELGMVSGQTVQDVFTMFLTDFNKNGDLCVGADYVNELMETVLPDTNKQQMMQDIKSPVTGKDIWAKLEQTDTVQLAQTLSSEYPQTIAVVLYHLSNEKASAVLNCFSESLTMDVLMRLTALKEVDADTLAGVEKGLEAGLKTLQSVKPKDGKEKAAGIISLMDRKTDILNTLFERSPELAGQLSADVIMFEDIADWDDTAIRTLLAQTDRQIVIYALKGASDKMKEAFSRNMSPAVWGGVLKETNKLSSVKVKDIDAAQYALVRTAQELVEQQKIVITKAK